MVELSNCNEPAIRERMVSYLLNFDEILAQNMAGHLDLTGHCRRPFRPHDRGVS
jgi:hypothetical protein